MPGLTTDGSALDALSDAVDEGMPRGSSVRLALMPPPSKRPERETLARRAGSRGHQRQRQLPSVRQRLRTRQVLLQGAARYVHLQSAADPLADRVPQRSRPSPTTSKPASTSRVIRVRVWAYGRPWRCSTPSSTNRIQMYADQLLDIDRGC